MTDESKNKLPEIGFIRLPKVLELIPVSKSSWWNGIKKGLYPQPVKLSTRVTAWRVEDIRALIADMSVDRKQEKKKPGRFGRIDK